jgi:hypothetical protein
MKSIDKAVKLSAQATRNELKRNSMRFAAVLLAAVAIFVAVPNAALAAAPQHHDQVPGFYRLKVGDLEVTHCTKIRACWMSPMRASWSAPASN